MINIVPLVFPVLFGSCTQTNNSPAVNNDTPPCKIKIKVGKEPGCIEVAHVNNDKIPDLIVANQLDSSVRRYHSLQYCR